jgi:hypothetical protein
MPGAPQPLNITRLQIGPKRGAMKGANLGSMGVKLRAKLVKLVSNCLNVNIVLAFLAGSSTSSLPSSTNILPRYLNWETTLTMPSLI